MILLNQILLNLTTVFVAAQPTPGGGYHLRSGPQPNPLDPLIAILGLVGAIALSVQRARDRASQYGPRDRFHETIRGRKPLTSEQFAATFFQPHLREIARRVRDRLQKVYPHDVRFIHPNDAPFEPPMFRNDVSLVPVEFLNQLEQEFRIKINDEAAGRLHTVRDFVLHISRRCH